MRLLVFWDSIWEGFYDYENWGWVNRLKIKLWDEIEVFNCSISAYTTKNILKIFDTFFNAVSASEKWKEKETIIIIITTWTNDSCILNWKRFVSLDKFQYNLTKILKLCEKTELVRKIFFLTSLNCDESKTTPVSWGEYYYKNDEIKKYNEVIKNIAVKNNIEYLDLYWTMDDSDLPDWLHPNSNWHKKIFEKVYNFLENKI